MKITPQNVFNAAWQAFIVEGRGPSIHSGRMIFGDSTCVYLNENGDKCAVGLCIPGGHPAQNFIGSVSKLWAKYPELFEEHVNKPVNGTFTMDVIGTNPHGSGDHLCSLLHLHSDMCVLSQSQSALHDSCVGDDGNWKYSYGEMKRRYLDFAKTYKLDIPLDLK